MKSKRIQLSRAEKAGRRKTLEAMLPWPGPNEEIILELVVSEPI